MANYTIRIGFTNNYSMPADAGVLSLVGQAVALTYTPASTMIPSARLTANWTDAGVKNGIPNYTTISTTISTAGGNNSTSNTTTIQNAITAAANQTVVQIEPGWYNCGDLNMKTGVVLRGRGDYFPATNSNTFGTGTKTFTKPATFTYATGVVVRAWDPLDHNKFVQGTVTSDSGTTLTINATSFGGSGTGTSWRVSITVIQTTGTGTHFNFGSSIPFYGDPTGKFRTIASGNNAGSTQVTLNTGTPTPSVGQMILFTELNNSSFVSPTTSNGTANWASGFTDGAGNGVPTRLRGQLGMISQVNGNIVTFEPPLFTDYDQTPWAMFATPSIQNAGLENIMVFCTDTGSTTINAQTAYNCWVKGCTFDFTDGDHAALDWCLRFEFRDSHIYDAFVHAAGSFDTQIGLRFKSTYCRIENNILERTHAGVITEWGAAGNVISYNYATGTYDDFIAGGNRWLIQDYNLNHGAHPQFNLCDGNIGAKMNMDAIWGTGSHGIWLRNYMSGHRQVPVTPLSSRGTKGALTDLTQSAICYDVWQGQTTMSLIGNVGGNKGNWVGRNPQRKDTTGSAGSTAYSNPPYVFIYNKGGGGDASGAPSAPILPNPTATLIEHGNWDTVTNGIVWDATISDHNIPNSLCYSSKPSWWGNTIPWPPIDPTNVPADMTTITNPAKYRYENGVAPS